MAGTAQELFPNRTGGVRPRRTRTPSNVPVGRPAARACSATRPSPRLSSTARPTQIRGHPRTLAASPSVIAHESQQTPAAGPRSANGRAREAFSRVPSRRPATRPGLGGRSQGAIPGAIGGRYRTTQGDSPRQFVQLNALQSDARRRTATLRRCLLSSGSRVRILPGAQGGLHVSAGCLFAFGPCRAAVTAAGQDQGRCIPAFPRTSRAIAYRLSGVCGLAALNLWSMLKQDRIRAGQSQT